MSEIKVDTLTGKTTANDVTVTVGATATMSLEQGLAKVWINMDGTGTISTRDSFNLASITDSGTGTYQHNSTNAMSSDDYTCVYNAGNGSGNSDDSTNPGNAFSSSHPNTSSQAVMETMNETASSIDRDYIGGMWHGDLA